MHRSCELHFLLLNFSLAIVFIFRTVLTIGLSVLTRHLLQISSVREMFTDQNVIIGCDVIFEAKVIVQVDAPCEEEAGVEKGKSVFTVDRVLLRFRFGEAVVTSPPEERAVSTRNSL